MFSPPAVRQALRSGKRGTRNRQTRPRELGVQHLPHLDEEPEEENLKDDHPRHHRVHHRLLFLCRSVQRLR